MHAFEPRQHPNSVAMVGDHTLLVMLHNLGKVGFRVYMHMPYLRPHGTACATPFIS